MGEKENNHIDPCAFARILKTVQLFLANNNLDETSQCLLKEIESKFHNTQLNDASPKGLVLRPDDPGRKDSDVIISVGQKFTVNQSGKKCGNSACSKKNVAGNPDPTEEDLDNLTEVIRKLKEQKLKDCNNGDSFTTVCNLDNGGHAGTVITHRVTEIVHLRHGYSCTCIQRPAELDEKTKNKKSDTEKTKRDKSKGRLSQQGKGSAQKDEQTIAKKDVESLKSGTPKDSLSSKVQEEQSTPDDVKLLDENISQKSKKKPITPCPLHVKAQAARKGSGSKQDTPTVAPGDEDIRKAKENATVEGSVSADEKSQSPQKSFVSSQGGETATAEGPEIANNAEQNALPQKSKDKAAVAVSSQNDAPGEVALENTAEKNVSPQKSIDKASVAENGSQSKSPVSQKSIVSSQDVELLAVQDLETINASEKFVESQKSKDSTVASNLSPQSPRKSLVSHIEIAPEVTTINEVGDTSEKNMVPTIATTPQSPRKSLVSNQEITEPSDKQKEKVSGCAKKTHNKKSKEKPRPSIVSSSQLTVDTQKPQSSLLSNQDVVATEPTYNDDGEVINAVDKYILPTISHENISPVAELTSSSKSQSHQESLPPVAQVPSPVKPESQQQSLASKQDKTSIVPVVKDVEKVNGSDKSPSRKKSKDKRSSSATSSAQAKSHSTNKSPASNEDNLSKHSIVAAHGRISKELFQVGQESVSAISSTKTDNKVEDSASSKQATAVTSAADSKTYQGSKDSSQKDSDKVILRAAEKLKEPKSKPQESPSIPSAGSSIVTADIVKQGKRPQNKKRSISCYSKPKIDSNCNLNDKDKRKTKTKDENSPEVQDIQDETKLEDVTNRKSIVTVVDAQDTSDFTNPSLFQHAPKVDSLELIQSEQFRASEKWPVESKVQVYSFSPSARESSVHKESEYPTTDEFVATKLKDTSIQTSSIIKFPNEPHLNDKATMSMLDNIPNKDIPLASTPLDYDRVKEDLLNADTDKKLLLLQALRWRITKSDAKTRQRNLDAFIRYDVLGLEQIPVPYEQSILNSYFCSEDSPNAIQEDMARFLNALASMAKGRMYLKSDTDFIINTLVPILMDQKEGVKIFDLTREFILAIIQKLSIDQDIRRELISKGLLEWLIDYIITKHNKMTNYEADYSTALLTNLCLENEARERCVQIKDKVVDMIFVLVQTPHECCLQYLNNILYSLLTKYYINKLAMNKCLTCKLIDLHSKMKEPNRQKQLRDVIAIHTSVTNEDVEFNKSEFPERVYTDYIEPELEMNDPVNQRPNGDDFLQTYVLTGEKLKTALKIMEAFVPDVQSSRNTKGVDGKKKKSYNSPDRRDGGLNYNMQSIEQREMEKNKLGKNKSQYNTACTGLPACRCRYCCYYSYVPPFRCYKEKTYSCECYDTVQDCSDGPSSSNASRGGAPTSYFNKYCDYYSYYPYCP